MVILDGEYVDAKKINPKDHKFIGSFRPPTKPMGGYVQCSCGQVLQTILDVHNHWALGHADMPQYQTINEV